MKGNVMCFFKLFTNVEKVDFTSGDHDADQCSVVCAEALWMRSTDTLILMKLQWPT